MLFSRNTRNIIKDVKVIVNYAKHSTNMSNKGLCFGGKIKWVSKRKAFCVKLDPFRL